MINRSGCRRRWVFGCAGVSALLFIGFLFLSTYSVTGSWVPTNYEKKLHRRLYDSGDIERLKAYARSVQDRNVSVADEPPEELRAIGVRWIASRGITGKIIEFNFSGGGAVSSGVLITPPGHDPGPFYKKWEDGIFGFERAK